MQLSDGLQSILKVHLGWHKSRLDGFVGMGCGFHLKDTRLTRYFRIKKVMVFLAIGFCWAHKTGEWKNKVVKPLEVKKHGRLEHSLFRYGLNHLIDTFGCFIESNLSCLPSRARGLPIRFILFF